MSASAESAWPDRLARHFESELSALLSAARSRNGDSIHQIRLFIKETRAVLRLRTELPAGFRRNLNRKLREISLRLAPYRDAETLRHELERALHGIHPPAVLESGGRAREVLHRESTRLESHREAATRSALRALGGLKLEQVLCRHHPPDRARIRKALLKSYRKGCRRYRRIRKTPARVPAELHEWRKRAKDLYYQLDALSLSSAGRPSSADAKKLRRRLKALGRDLGQVLDQERLLRFLRDHPENDALVSRVEAELKKCRRNALQCGRGLYRRSTPDCLRRVASRAP